MILVGLQLSTQNLAQSIVVWLFHVKEVGETRFERERGGEGKEEEEEEASAAGSVYRPSPSQNQKLRSRAVTAQRRSGEKKGALRELPYKKKAFRRRSN